MILQQQIHTSSYNILKQSFVMAQNNGLDLSFFNNSKLQTEINYSILFDNQNKQVLQLSIPPNCSVYLKGKIIYSNFLDENLPKDGGFTGVFSKGLNMYLWRNKTQQMQVVGLTHILFSGPILILDLAVYKESLYVNLHKIMTSKYSIENDLLLHPKLKHFMLAEFREKTVSLEAFFRNNQKIVLQTNSNIIEKYLAPGQEFYLYFGQAIAISKTVFVEKINNKTKLIGPGWLFFQTGVQFQIQKQNNTAKIFAFLFFFLFSLLINLLEF